MKAHLGIDTGQLGDQSKIFKNKKVFMTQGPVVLSLSLVLFSKLFITHRSKQSTLFNY